MTHSPATETKTERARTRAATRRRRARLIPSSFTLAAWRLRQTWRLLLIAGLGNIAAVLLVCIVPLFTQVALSAGLQGVLTGSSDASQIVVEAIDTAPTAQDAAAIQQQLDHIVASDMGSYAKPSEPLFSVSLPDLVLVPGPGQGPGANGNGSGAAQLQVYGADMTQAAQQYTIVSGRLPGASSADLEIALTQSDAAALNATVGTVLHAQIPGPQQQQAQVPTLALHVVGIFLPPATSGPSASQGLINGPVFGPGRMYGGFGGPNFYSVLASNQAIFAALAASGLTAGGAADGQPQYGPPPVLAWAYQLDTSRVSADALNDVLDRLGRVQTDVPGQLNGTHGLQGIFLDSGAVQALGNFRLQILLLQIPLFLLLLQVIALVLLFVRMMAGMLVDRQADAVATLRSRGATRRQVFNAFTLHNLGLCLLALVVGPLVAIPLVRVLSLRSLPPASQSAVAAIAGNPLAVAWGLRWYVLVTVVVAGLAMILATNRAAGNNILTLRRENARTTAKPFWQRLNLDLIFGGLSLIGYVAYTLAVRQVDPRVQLVLSPLSLLAALAMLVAAALLFLRLLPLLLALGSRLSSRGRGASSMLALTQMARAPKQPIRMTLLLALATGFTLFTLVYSASQAQRLVDIATYQTGADFTGTVPASVSAQASTANLTARYRAIPGVTGAALGYTASVGPNGVSAGIPLQLFAVDADTYAQSARWTDQESTQPLGDLMARLRAARGGAATADSVPAILDAATWQALHLTPGAQFTLEPPGYQAQSETMRFVAVAQVLHIPTVYNSYQGGGFSGIGGVLADYQTYATVYRHDLGSDAPAANTAWINTHDDAASLSSVRKALSQGNLALGALQDRRQLIDDQRANPLQIDLANTLLIGAATALLLALIGIWVGSWLSARGRLVNFAVLRALGTTPRQLRFMLVWEQVIVYVAGLALGIVLGWVLSLIALPLLIFVELATRGTFQNTPNVPLARVVVPGSTLALALGVLIAICVLALVLTMGALARLSLGQTLRLNED
ncbi:MAG TPA: FtsX-like permease family protein [Ktedonobacterales bacterium]